MHIKSVLSSRLPILVIGGACFSQAAVATTFEVCSGSGCQFRTIQSAVNAASSGDTINIAPGRYVENVTISGKALTLVGAGGVFSYCSVAPLNHHLAPCGVSEVSASPTGTGPVFTLGSGISGDTPRLITIQGLTISHGTHSGGSSVGGGVQVRAGAYLQLSGSIISQNSAEQGGGVGVNTPGAPATTISNCLIEGNVAFLLLNSGAGAYPLFAHYGGGVAVLNGSKVAIQNSTITQNEAENGGGIYLDSGSNLTMTGTTVSENTATGYFSAGYPEGAAGGGLYTVGTFSITESSITGNTGLGHDGGGGLFLDLPADSSSTITSTIIDRNVASENGLGGGLAVGGASGSTLSLVKDFIVENQNGGVLNYGINLVLTGTLITANTGTNLCQPNTPGGCD